MRSPDRLGSPAKNSVPPGLSTRLNSAKQASRSGRWCSTAWPSTRSKLSSSNGSCDASQAAVSTVQPELGRVVLERLQHAGRDVGAGRLPDHAGLQQVQAEVARPGADLQRARERPGRRAEQLRELAEHLLVADLAERDAPLGVVAVGRHVVVATVDVQDLVLGGRRDHWAPMSVAASGRRGLCDPAQDPGEVLGRGAAGDEAERLAARERREDQAGGVGRGRAGGRRGRRRRSRARCRRGPSRSRRRRAGSGWRAGGRAAPRRPRRRPRSSR